MNTSDEIRLSVLCDDSAGRKGLVGEHGLSVLVESAGARVLFDTGPPGFDLARNADQMGVDPKAVDCIALSHGHYDHIGGLAEVLEGAGGLKVIAHPQVFRNRYARRGSGVLREIGPPLSQAEYERLGARFCLSAEPVQLSEVLLTTGEVPGYEAQAPAANLLMETEEGLVADDFADDLSLLLNLPAGVVILTGCAHRGLDNIARRAEELTQQPVRVIVGGTHLVGVEESHARRMISGLNKRGVAVIAACHCTGAQGLEYLRTYFAGELLPVVTGDVITASSDGRLKVSD